MQRKIAKFLAIVQLCSVFTIFLGASSSSVYANSEVLNPKVEVLLEKTKGYQDQDEITVLVDINDNVMANKYGLIVPDISQIKTEEGLLKQIDYARRSHDIVLNQMEEKGINYQVHYSYDTLLNGFSLKTSLEDAKKIAQLEEIASIQVNEKIGERKLNLFRFRSLGPNEMIHANEAWEKDFTGKEQIVAIIDSGADPNHEVFKKIDSPKYTQVSMEERIQRTGATKGKYFNEKIPFGFNYGDRDLNIKEANEYSHGMHVAGIIGANSDTMKGVAPNAQLLIMRVFSDKGFFGGGTSHEIYNKAIDDAVKLGADSINMSLGSTGISDSRVEITTKNLLSDARSAGIGVAIAAGNDGFAGWGAAEHPKASNPDYGVISSPSNVDISLSVASVDNVQLRQKSLLLKTGEEDLRFPYAPGEGSTLPKEEFDFVDCGYGSEEEIPAKVEGKIALIKRGEEKGKEELNFADKILNAEKKKAIGAVIYNNVDENDLVNMAGLKEANVEIPSVFISKTSGEELLKHINGKLKFEDESTLHDNPNKYRVSNFSSWGVTSEGNLKPDISAPGGGIYSSINNNKYENMNGTSMASPHVAAGIALVKKYVESNFTNVEKTEVQGLVKNLIMSTAKPYYDKEAGAYTSPRSQGAGLMNLDGATESKVVLEGSNKVSSINLGNLEGNQVRIQGRIHNYGNEAKTYDYKALLNTDSVEGDKILLKPRKLMESSKTEITVNPGESKVFEVSFELEESVLTELAEKMPNGFFLEGYVFFEDKSQNKVDLSLPFVGFKGTWNNLPVIEKSIYKYGQGNTRPIFYKHASEQTHPFTHLFTRKGMEEIVLGQSMDKNKNSVYREENIAFSPNGDGKGDTVNFMGTFFRNYKDFKINIYKKEDIERAEPIYSVSKEEDNGVKNFFQINPFAGNNLSTTKGHWLWDGKNRFKELVQEGEYIFQVVVKHDSTNASEQKIEFPVKVDNTLPIIKKSIYNPETHEFKIEKYNDNISGIKSTVVVFKDQEFLADENGIFSLPKDIDLEKAEIRITDYALNSSRTPLSKAIRSGNEYMISVNPKINTGAVDAEGFKWEVVNQGGQVVDPYNLVPGSYTLRIKHVKEEYELVSPNEISFEIGEGEYSKVIDVEFRYKDRVEALVQLSNRRNADVRLFLLDINTGEQYELRSSHGTENYMANVPEGDYKIITKDLEEGYVAVYANAYFKDGIYKVSSDMDLSLIPKVAIQKIRLADVNVQVNRNGYQGKLDIIAIADDLNRTKTSISLEEGENEGILPLPAKVSHTVYISQIEGYGSNSQKIYVNPSNNSLNFTLNLGEDSSELPVFKEMLQYKINEAKYLKGTVYIKDSSKLDMALEEAQRVLKDPNAEQQEVDKVQKQLETIIQRIKDINNGKVDKTELEATLKEAQKAYSQIKPGEYTENSVAFLKVNIEAAMGFLKNPETTQEQVDNMVELLKEGIENLTTVSGEKERAELAKILEETRPILKEASEYTEETFEDFKYHFDLAKDAFDDKDSSVESIKEATSKLVLYFNQLKKAPAEEPEDPSQDEGKKVYKHSLPVKILKDEGIEESKVHSLIEKPVLVMEKNGEFEYTLKFKPLQVGEILGTIKSFEITSPGYEKTVDVKELEGEYNQGFTFILKDKVKKLDIRFDINPIHTKEDVDIVFDWDNVVTEEVDQPDTPGTDPTDPGEDPDTPEDGEGNLAQKHQVLLHEIRLNRYDLLPSADKTVKNKQDLPKDIQIKWTRVVDTSTVGEKVGRIRVSFSDGSFVDKYVKIHVLKNSSSYIPYPNDGNKESIKVDPVEKKAEDQGKKLEEKQVVKDTDFKDIQGHWAKKAIDFVVSKGYFKGEGYGLFSPNRGITRGEFVTVLGRIQKVNSIHYKKVRFHDLDSSKFYTPYVNWASEMGIVSGVGEGNFKPDKILTREEMSKIILNYLEASNIQLSQKASINYVDTQEISDWAKPSVKKASELGIVQGVENGKFSPQGQFTRAQVAQVLYNIENK